MKENIYTIAIDGPAGAGKSTIAKEAAKVLDIEYIDTGAMFRALTLKVLNLNIEPRNVEEVINILSSTSIDFKNNSIYLDGNLVDKEIRDDRISKNVSNIAIIKEVRDKMILLQREMSKSKSVIMDGRDIGTVVLPNSKYKFFITASVEERARRRYKDLIQQGDKEVTLEQIELDIIKRDHIDSTREIAPLKKANDAYIIDNTNKTIEECVNIIYEIVENRGEK